jgi:acetoin utilization deacetylase AcuC-like enzyme
MPDGGAGYCVLNDLAAAASALLAEGAVRRVLVVDLDVHQGDGTAVCLAHDPRVFTLSVHSERNFPARKAHSSLDVGLPDGTGDADYLDAVRPALLSAISRARPDIILYQAGVDPHADDRLGRLSLSDEGLEARDRLVGATARASGIALASTMGGGYGADVRALGRRHAATVATLADVFFGGSAADVP